MMDSAPGLYSAKMMDPDPESIIRIRNSVFGIVPRGILFISFPPSLSLSFFLHVSFLSTF